MATEWTRIFFCIYFVPHSLLRRHGETHHSEVQKTLKSTAAGASSRTPLGEITALPRRMCWIKHRKLWSLDFTDTKAYTCM